MTVLLVALAALLGAQDSQGVYQPGQGVTVPRLLRAGGRYGGQSTRLGLATLAVWHASDHYGQLVVYARMNSVVPPASR